ncbi:MAG: hypothetical protein PHD48_04405 [Alphaproteobacteria bacterium]|nr:hypothetical protein [Alphaproteobacteria bacterium]
MSINKKANLIASLIAAGYIVTACSPISNTPALDLSEDDQNIVENTGETGQAMPVVIMDPRKKGKAPLHSRIAGSRNVTVKPVFDTSPNQGKQGKGSDYKEEVTYTEQSESDEVLVMGLSVDTTKNSKHRYFTALQRIKGIDHLNDAQLGQTLDGNSPGSEWSMIARNAAAVFGDVAHGARDINGIHVDNQMGNAAEKTANSYDYWAKHWTADSITNTLSGGTTTIGDITTSSSLENYLEFNPEIINSSENNIETINSIENNLETINSSENNLPSSGRSSTPQQGRDHDKHDGGCSIDCGKTSSTTIPARRGTDTTVYALSGMSLNVNKTPLTVNFG